MHFTEAYTHLLDRKWLQMLKEDVGPRYSVQPLTKDVEGIYKHGAHFITPMPDIASLPEKRIGER